MALNSSYEKQRLHELIDSIPTEQNSAFLQAIDALRHDPVLLSLLNAPPDDEPYTDEQRSEDAESEASIARGEGIRSEDLLREFGL